MSSIEIPTTGITVTQEQIDLINKAADTILSAESSKLAARESMTQAEQGQLAALKDALAAYPGVVSEAIWDSCFKANVFERLKQSPSKDTLVNRLKRATMGLTLAKEELSFAPQGDHTNLKKYADWVGVKLQSSIDPATGKPRLKSISRAAGSKAPKLRDGQTYWLLGAGADEKHPSVIGDHGDLDALKRVAFLRRDEFARFWFIIAPKPQPLDLSAADEAVEYHENTAVFAESVTLGSA